MSNYDDQHPTSEEHTSRTTKTKAKPWGGFFAGIGGAFIGAGIILAASPWLLSTMEDEETAGPEERENGIEEEVVETEEVSLDINTDISEAVEGVSKAVVGVFNLQQSDFWSNEGVNEGTGSGVVYREEGDSAYIVTNQHVIEGAGQVEVSLASGSRVEAEILGEDVLTDLAVLRIPSDEVETVANFGDSETLRSGEPAIAIGNPLGPEFSRTVTQGIISATERSIPVDLTGDGQMDWNAEVLQTDAAINPGNSGGALININGDVIGINSMKIAQAAVEGIGFAIPTSIALPVIEDLEQFGEVQRPEMGVSISSLSEIPSYHWQETLGLPEDVEEGVFIMDVITGSPAAEAGLQEYDVIIEIDGQPIADGHDLRQYLYNEAESDGTIEVSIYRGNSQETLEVQLQPQQQQF
ncbi:HtrA-like peptidase [Salsuginibacillus halophilus]|uniref:HtrA-like peptidase n=1 Tax=Salsuginibacillus halophilus TaxID=517424 RepID=A0A2P8HI67_9BACI|nr:trypsin-like peptidase domain-containing protein [Salsuginibacillus halophilus]PSL45911.1 HtrA-like peptidase [Salsuginibacillus halophilus]